jgi:hypothetical protein
MKMKKSVDAKEMKAPITATMVQPAKASGLYGRRLGGRWLVSVNNRPLR